VFFVVGRCFAGFFENLACSVMVIGGEVVVECVVNVEWKMSFLGC
jgi:hypothetical protein